MFRFFKFCSDETNDFVSRYELKIKKLFKSAKPFKNLATRKKIVLQLIQVTFLCISWYKCECHYRGQRHSGWAHASSDPLEKTKKKWWRHSEVYKVIFFCEKKNSTRPEWFQDELHIESFALFHISQALRVLRALSNAFFSICSSS